MIEKKGLSATETNLLAVPYDKLSPAAQILVDGILQTHQSPEPVAVNESIKQYLQEAAGEQAEARSAEIDLRAELITIEALIQQLQARHHFVGAELRQIRESDADCQKRLDQIQLEGVS